MKKNTKKEVMGICLTSKLYDKIIHMPSKSHETIPLKLFSAKGTLRATEFCGDFGLII
jgi:hypothetical protein